MPDVTGIRRFKEEMTAYTHMRTPSHAHRLPGLSIAEVKRELELACMGLDSEFTFQGRRLKPGPLLNAMILYFTRRMDDVQRRDVAAWGLAEYERLLSLDEPAGAGDTPLPELGDVEVTDVKGTSKRKGGQRKKRG